MVGTERTLKSRNSKNFYVKRVFGSCYLPCVPTERDVICFFDSIASKYDDLITRPLNETVNHWLIQKVLERARCNGAEFHLLDYGIGTGISYDVIKRFFSSLPCIRDFVQPPLECGPINKFSIYHHPHTYSRKHI